MNNVIFQGIYSPGIVCVIHITRVHMTYEHMNSFLGAVDTLCLRREKSICSIYMQMSKGYL